MDNIKTRFPSFYIVSYYTGYIVLGTAMLMAVPLVTSLALSEWNPALDFVISISVSALVGCFLMIIGRKTRRGEVQVDWKYG